MEIAGTVVAIFAFLFSVAAFVITFSRSRKVEKMIITHEVLKNFYETENNILGVDRIKDKDKWKLRHLQYLNMWEWFAFLVNHGKLKDSPDWEYQSHLI